MVAMQEKEIYNIVKEAFEQAGILFSSDEDIMLSEYVVDSIQYITSIVNIENALGIEVPNELLLPEKMQTLKAFSSVLVDLVKNPSSDILNIEWDKGEIGRG